MAKNDSDSTVLEGKQIEDTSMNDSISKTNAANHLWRRHSKTLLTAAAILVAGFLSFQGLTNNIFWDDEANTALFARNLNNYGELTGWDGQNLIGFKSGGELDENLLNFFMPPLQYYVASLGFLIFGETTFGGRAPFVIVGLLTFVALAFLTRNFMGKDSPWFLPLWVLALTPAFLLYIRNCRYYALGALFAITLLAAWTSRVDSKTRLAIATTLAVLSAVGLMLTNYLNAASFLLLLPLMFLLEPYRNKQHLLMFAAVCAATGIMALRIYIYANPFRADIARVDAMEGMARYLKLLWFNLRDLSSFEFVPVGILPILGLPFLAKRFASTRPLTKQGLLITAAIVLAILPIALFSPQSASKSMAADVRYLVPLIPLGAILTAVILQILWRILKPIAVIVALLLVFSNILHVSYTGIETGWTSKTRDVECTLCQYVGEIFNDYNTLTERITEHLNNLPNDEVIYIKPSYLSYSPMFYVPRHKYCCQIEKNRKIIKELASKLPRYLFWDEASQYITTAFTHRAEGENNISGALVFGDKKETSGKYEMTHLWNIYNKECSRPEIPWHAFSQNDLNEFHETDRSGGYYVANVTRYTKKQPSKTCSSRKRNTHQTCRQQ